MRAARASGTLIRPGSASIPLTVEIDAARSSFARMVETTSPRTTWLWLGIGLPAFVLLVGLIVRWRNRTVAAAVLKEADKLEARRLRRASRA